jgi:hypothetical protein
MDIFLQDFKIASTTHNDIIIFVTFEVGLHKNKVWKVEVNISRHCNIGMILIDICWIIN